LLLRAFLSLLPRDAGSPTWWATLIGVRSKAWRFFLSDSDGDTRKHELTFFERKYGTLLIIVYHYTESSGYNPEQNF
jgi:hypothetical protein